VKARRIIVSVVAVLIAGLTLGSHAAAASAMSDLDPSFGGGDGWVHSGLTWWQPPRPGWETAQALAVQRDGRIIVLGYSRQIGGLLPALFRYMPDGSPDPSFGTSGAGGVTTAFGSSALPVSMALQRNGRIVVLAAKPDHGSIVLARYMPDGSLDPSFGEAGLVLSTPGFRKSASVNSVVIQRTGRIVVGGTSARPADFTLAGYRPDGTLDARFGNGGVVSVDFANTDDHLAEVALDDRGRILAAGTVIRSRPPVTPSDDPRLDPSMGVARFSADGALDTSFGVDGRSVIAFTRGFVDDHTAVRALTIQPDGGVVLAGVTKEQAQWGPAFVRLELDGRIDRSFGDHGRVTPSMLPAVDGVPMETARDVLIDSRDRIVAAIKLPLGVGLPAAIIRLLPDGSLDTAFSDDGAARTGLPYGHDITAIAFQDDRIIAAGGINDRATWNVDFVVLAFRS
jgi:uncharacterized delta-60 repeat protein